ncbi:alanine racemase [Patescibacteria group bacterium]|nr:alanine racemase [Patescibacteria group bacterium]MBU1673596.1 alanine racemase [Patescibacteria group bacterium]MBU1964042.1 alanine racemase [Patescibacteria group bacterium]
MGFTRVEIKKDNIVHNLEMFRKLASKDRLLMPVVKSNAYGHGIIGIAKIIEETGLADKICTVNSEEALLLRDNNIKSPVFILSYWSEEDAKKLSDSRTEFSIYNIDQAKYLSGLNKNIKVHLKVDTGTSRLGVLASEFINFAKDVAVLPSLEIEGVFTHYANSEEDNAFTREQTKELEDIEGELIKEGIKVNCYHAACSAASMSSPNGYFDGIRLGLSLYGLWPSPFSQAMAEKNYDWLELKPALTWKTKIIQVKVIPKGQFVGYGSTFRAKEPLKMAVLPVGYNEGYDRLLSNKGEVLANGKRCKVLGRVCMNLTMIDVSEVDAKAGDEVILLGNEITAEEFAAWADTINYEVVTRINPLIPRVYI